MNKFQSFIEGIENQPDEMGVQKLVHALCFHIADQFEWLPITASPFSDSANARIRSVGRSSKANNGGS